MVKTTEPYYLIPLNAQLPIPPPVATRTSGLACSHKDCSHQPLRTTTYYTPSRQGVTPTISVRCKYGHHRTYYVHKLEAEILDRNTALASVRTQNTHIPARVDAQTTADALLAMELHATINGPNTPLTPPQTQAQSSQQVTGNEQKQGICSGVNGVFAKSHHKRKNAGCTNNACVGCCYLVNGSAGCGPHTTIQNKKRRDAVAGKKASKDHPGHVDPAFYEDEIDTTRETQKPIPNYAQDSQYQGSEKYLSRNRLMNAPIKPLSNWPIKVYQLLCGYRTRKAPMSHLTYGEWWLPSGLDLHWNSVIYLLKWRRVSLVLHGTALCVFGMIASKSGL